MIILYVSNSIWKNEKGTFSFSLFFCYKKFSIIIIDNRPYNYDDNNKYQAFHIFFSSVSFFCHYWKWMTFIIRVKHSVYFHLFISSFKSICLHKIWYVWNVLTIFTLLNYYIIRLHFSLWKIFFVSYVREW